MPSSPPTRGAIVRLDGASVRQQFPSLGLSFGSAPVAYFDNPAGTQVPARVQSAVTDYFTCANANSHGVFATSRRTDHLITRARELMAAFVNAESASEIVFGPNMTTLTYAVSRAFGRLLSAGDEVIVSDLDHDANIGPWLALEERGVVIRRIPVRHPDGTLDLARFEQLLSPRTRLVAVGYASNALGTINDIAKITELAHAAGALVWVDAVHYAPHGLIDVRAAKVDFLVCSAYKFFGPHVGVLWGKAELLARLPVQQVRPAPQGGPEKFETGTKNHEGLGSTWGWLSAGGRLPLRGGA
jgi:cysteine desulfurase family protein (TIGR01976 family)